MNKQPFFSIIIPTYNRASELDKCLSSLVCQTHKNFEVIVCDDGSTDTTNEVIKKYENLFSLVYLWQENWGGPARPRNIGIKASKGNWICFLDSDDTFYSQKLEISAKHTDYCDFIYHDMAINEGFGKPLKYTSCRNLKNNAFRDLMLNGNFICNSSVCVKREIINKAGFFTEDKELIGIEDFDLWLRISLLNCRFKYIPVCLGEYWYGGGNISNTQKINFKRDEILYKPYYQKLNYFDKLGHKASLYYSYASDYLKFGNKKKACVFLFKSLLLGNLTIKAKTITKLFFGTKDIKLRFWHKPDRIYADNSYNN